MSIVASVALAAATTIQEEPLVAPAFVFPVIALAVFTVLGAVAWSYRDVANRHPVRGTGSDTPHGN